MALVKNFLLFGGWIPTLLGGGATVWWLKSDKTIRDVLSKRGVVFWDSKEEFDRVYDEFEDDDNLTQDIPDVKNSKGKAILEWCKEKLEWSLTKENVEEILPKAKKYCLGNKKITSGLSKFRNFENIFELLNDDNVDGKVGAGVVIAHFGDDSNQDSYYFLENGNDLKQQNWQKINTNRRNMTARKLYIDEKKYKILSGPDGDAQKKWQARADGYDKVDNYHYSPFRNKQPIPGLEKAWGESSRNSNSKVNLLKQKCDEFLTKKYEDEESLKFAHGHFVNWCIEDIELDKHALEIYKN